MKEEMKKLCCIQIDFWDKLKDVLEATHDCTDEEVCQLWHKHFKENREAVQQLIKIKVMIDKIEEEKKNGNH